MFMQKPCPALRRHLSFGRKVHIMKNCEMTMCTFKNSFETALGVTRRTCALILQPM